MSKRAVEYVRRMRGGAQAHLLRCEDQAYYVTKFQNNPQHLRILANEMLTIKRKAGRLIWLNPLLGNPSYEPLTRGMAAALPLVDDFAAAHNLAALRDLAGRLSL